MNEIPSLSDRATGGRASRMLSRKTTETDYWYTIGYVVTPHGVVGVYMQADHTSLSVVRARDPQALALVLHDAGTRWG